MVVPGGVEVTSADPVFSNLAADDINSEPTEVESMCPQCGENGVTRLLLTRIPHYKEIILMSFHCDACYFSNNEIQSGGMIQEKGERLTVTIATERDLSRQIVKSDSATLSVPSLELEIPAFSQKGEVTTVEGVLSRTIAGLQQDQPVRKIMEPEAAQQIEEFVNKIEQVMLLKSPFTMTLDDPTGNSFIENPFAPGPDPNREVEVYIRSKDQDHLLGLYTQQEVRDQEDFNGVTEADGDQVTTLTEARLQEEILTFPTNCPECNAPAETNMKMTNIPYFKEVVIMSTVCDYCGHRTNEIKSGGGIEDKGRKISLKVTDPSDMSRDVLKSHTCSLAIPELEFEMGGAALGGKFTTLEGLMNNILEEIEKNSVWGGSDAVAPDISERMAVFKNKFNDCLSTKIPFSIILDDPAGNSYMQNVYAPEDDPEMSVEEYTRSWDQNEELGLNDMKVEGYEEEEER